MRSIAVSLWLAVMLSGCSSAVDPAQEAGTPASKREEVKIELMPEGTDERVRRVFLNEFQQKTRLEIEFRDGSTGGEIYHPSGRLKQRWRTYPHSSQLLMQDVFQADGKTVGLSRRYHRNGKLDREIKLLPAGGYHLVQFRDDGTLLTELLVRADGSAERLHYGADGRLLEGKSVVSVSGEVDSWSYDDGGAILAHSHWQRNGDQSVTYYRADGSVRLRQWWRILRNFDTAAGARRHRGWVLERVEEYDTDGRWLLRRILLEDGPEDVNAVREVQVFHRDGTCSVRSLSAQRKVIKQETRAADGSVLEVQSFEAGKEPVEEIAEELLECWFVIGHKFDNFDK